MIIRDVDLSSIDEINERIKSIDRQIEKAESVWNPREYNKHHNKIAKLNSRKDALWTRRANLLQKQKKKIKETKTDKKEEITEETQEQKKESKEMKITNKKTIERLKAMNRILTKAKTERDFKKYFCADSEVLYVTNGHEIAIMKMEGIENGTYTLNKVSNNEFELIKLDIDINYPASIPNIVETAKDETANKEYFNIGDAPGLYEVAICQLILNSKVVFNFKLSEKLKKFGADFTVYYKNEKSPILWETKDLIYILMPILV